MNNRYSKKIQHILEEGKKCKKKMTVIGPTGPMGPTGPSGITISTFGRKYNIATTAIVLDANIAQNISLENAGVVNNISILDQNLLTITETGIYLIEYYFSGTANQNTNLTIEVKQNETPIESTAITKSANANNDISFVGSTINSLNENDKIGLSLKSTIATTVTPSSNTNAYLNIIRLS